MADSVFARAADLDIGKSPARVSRVTIKANNNTVYTAGDDTGRAIEKTIPWGTQEMADAILASIKDYEYKPFTATDAIIDPAAEIGDGVTINGFYSVLAQKEVNYGALTLMKLAAPISSEIEDEYPYVSKTQREVQRQESQIYSRITKTAEEIRLEVVKEVEGLTSSFDVKLDEIRGEVTDAVNGLSSSVDVKLGEITAQVTGLDGRVGEVELTADGLTTTVSDLNGAFSKVEQTVNGWTYTDPDGTTKVKGSSIETGSLVLTGSITWADLNSSVQNSINNAGISEATARSIASTVITSTLVSSPTIRGANIEGGAFYNLRKSYWVELGGGGQGDEDEVFRLYSEWMPTHPIFSVWDNTYGIIGLHGYGHEFLTVDTSAAVDKTVPVGVWDFSGATVTWGSNGPVAVFG